MGAADLEIDVRDVRTVPALSTERNILRIDSDCISSLPPRHNPPASDRKYGKVCMSMRTLVLPPGTSFDVLPVRRLRIYQRDKFLERKK